VSLEHLSVKLHCLEETFIRDCLCPFLLGMPSSVKSLSLHSAAKYSIHPTYKELLTTMEQIRGIEVIGLKAFPNEDNSLIPLLLGLRHNQSVHKLALDRNNFT